MRRKQINILLIVLAIGIVFLIGKDFIGKKAGKNIENPFKYDLDEFRKVDSTTVLFKERITFNVKEESPKGIAVSGNSILVVTEKYLLKYDYSGNELSKFELPDTANCIATDANHKIWIGLLHGFCALDQDGKLLNKSKSFGERSVITSLAASNETIFVADAGNRIVYECNFTGEILSRIGEKDEVKKIPGYVIPSPYFDVAIDGDGFLWAANTGQHSLENYDHNGYLRTSWGKASNSIDGFCGCCNPAQFAIMKDQSFVTSEKGIPKIKLFDRKGVMKGIVAAPEMFENGWYAPDLAIDDDQRILALDLDRKQVRIFERKADGTK